MLNVVVILGKSEIAENFWYPSFNLPALLADRLRLADNMWIKTQLKGLLHILFLFKKSENTC